MIRTARCCCGSLSIAVDGNPILHTVCHCDNCKKRTGSAFGLSAYFPDASIIGRTGDAAAYTIDVDGSGNRQDRHFCVRCGTTLYWKISALPDWTGIAGGCFSGPALPDPTHTLADGEKCAWLQLPQDWELSVRWVDIVKRE